MLKLNIKIKIFLFSAFILLKIENRASYGRNCTYQKIIDNKLTKKENKQSNKKKQQQQQKQTL